MNNNDQRYSRESLRRVWKYLSFGAAALVLAVHGLAIPAAAQEFQANQLRLYYGDGHQLAGNGINETSRTTLEFQHFSAYEYGDLFFFFNGYRDHNWDGASTRVSFYSEGYAHLSAKSLGVSFGDGLLSDIGVGIGLNGGRDFLVALYGARASFNIPGFNVLTFGIYAYDNQVDGFNRDLDTTYQATLVWDAPLSIGDQKFSASGVIDWIGSQGSGTAKQIYVQPEIRWDLGRALGQKDGSFEVGLRYVHFNNKYGVEGVNENAYSVFLVKKF